MSNRPEDQDPGASGAEDASIAGGTFVDLPQASLDETGEHGGRARFEPPELRRVLDCYPLGEVTRIRELEAGSRKAPKVRVSSTEGEYLLKRRVARPELVERVVFNHGLQLHLENEGVPVARLVGTRRENRSMLIEDDRVYELFEWIEGRRLVRAAPEVRNAGRILGRLHRASVGFEPDRPSGVSGFHAAASLKVGFKRLEPAILSVESAADPAFLSSLVGDLRDLVAVAGDAVEEAGWSGLSRQPIHGDWHPGNLLFTPDQPTARKPGVVRAIIDFDSSRSEPRIVDVANGLLHFAMRSDRERSPSEWPTSLSPDRMQAMLEGWSEVVGGPVEREADLLPALMIEGLIAESVIPIAKSGTFAGVPGGSFLSMVREKARWIHKHAAQISGLLVG
ncbi:MAG: phosphotransferase [Phycisphaera sp.]|nr:phosphotransferase [Phycisphaera sp.]